MNNPFTSKRFTDIYLKHFNGGKSAISFDFIDRVSFIKHQIPGCYYNVGKNLTKGIYYQINAKASDFRNKTFIIYDVPTYFKVKDVPKDSRLKIKKIFQYNGFLMNLEGFNSSEAYINQNFSGKNRREFRSNQRRLEACFNIKYHFFYETIKKETLDTIFKEFHYLLSHRFAEKQTDYHHLDSAKWAYYTELVYEMINDKSASLLVIFKDEHPIGITLNFLADKILFETITVFDPDYFKFSIGKTSIIKLLDWCFENDVSISDFSKGDFDYKHKWSNEIYDFEYHILYDSQSLGSRLKASALASYFKLKLWMRERDWNSVYRKFRFMLKGGSNKTVEIQPSKIENIQALKNDGSYHDVDHNLVEYKFLKKFIYTFLFANPEREENIKIFKQNNEETYIISGSEKNQKITFSKKP